MNKKIGKEKKQFTETNKVDVFHYAYLLWQQGIKIEVLYFLGESKKEMHCPLEVKAPQIGPTLMHYENCASKLPSGLQKWLIQRLGGEINFVAIMKTRILCFAGLKINLCKK